MHLSTRIASTPRRAAQIFNIVIATAAISAGSPAIAQTAAVYTQHNDNGRTGANLSENILTTQNVNDDSFGLLFSRPVQGIIYAQPLYVPNVTIPNKGVHNVVYVATCQDILYAFDADDPAQNTPLWSVVLGNTFPVRGNGAMPYMGITSTPVIDPVTQTIYVVSISLENGSQIYRLHALSLSTGAEKKNSPVVIQGSVPGTGNGSVNGVVPFMPEQELNRPGLLLQNNVVYIAFGSHDDIDPYHGWIFGYSTKTMQQVAIFNATPNGSEGGIWQAGMGLAGDSQGNIYCITGNGSSDVQLGGNDYGECLMKLTPTNDPGGLAVTDWFMPFNVDYLNLKDADFGSSGPMVMPDTDLILAAGKARWLYAANKYGFGKFHEFWSNQNWQSVYHPIGRGWHVHGSPVYWKSPHLGPTIYFWNEQDFLKAYQLDPVTQQFTTTPSTASRDTCPIGPTNSFYMPGAILSLSANGSADGSGIVWASHPYDQNAQNANVPGILRAYDANDLSHELWNSYEDGSRDDYGIFAKNSAPTIANGKVYLGTGSNKLCIYGLFAGNPTLPTAPTTLTATPGAGVISLSWMASSGATSYQISRVGSDGSSVTFTAPATSTTFADTSALAGVAYQYAIQAANATGTSAAYGPVNAQLGVSGYDIAAGKVAIADSIAIPVDGQRLVIPSPTFAVDSGNGGDGSDEGDDRTSWLAADTQVGHWWRVDLGAPASVTGTAIRWPMASGYKYRLEGSLDGVSWTTLANHTASATTTEETTDSFTSTARYLRVTITGLSSGRTAGIKSFRAFGAVSAPGANALTTPGLLKCTTGDQQVSLQWTSNSAATGYNIYRGTAPGAESSTPYERSVNGTAFNDANVVNGTTYYYRVAAVGPGGTSAMSNEVQAKPMPVPYELLPQADTYTQSAFADSNFGSDNILVSKKAGSTPNDISRTSYLKFDLSPVTAPIAKADLYLYGKHYRPSGYATAQETVYAVSDISWLENALTWNNAPALGSPISTTLTNPLFQYYSWDLSPYIQAQKAEGQNVLSVAVAMPTAPSDAQGDTFYSREQGFEMPTLVVTPQPTTTNVIASASTYVQDGTYANTNFGSAGIMPVKKDAPGANRIAFLRFPVSGINAPIKRATLNLYGTHTLGGSYAPTDGVYGLTSSAWTETSITWATMPALGPELCSQHITPNNNWWTWDITNYVASQMNSGATTIDLAIAMDSLPLDRNGDVFWGRGQSSNKPILTIQTQ